MVLLRRPALLVRSNREVMGVRAWGTHHDSQVRQGSGTRGYSENPHGELFCALHVGFGLSGYLVCFPEVQVELVTASDSYAVASVPASIVGGATFLVPFSFVCFCVAFRLHLATQEKHSRTC